MKVTVRDIQDQDRSLGEFPIFPQITLPYPGTVLLFPRDRDMWESKAKKGRVAHYVWDLKAEETGDLEIRMIVSFEK